MKMMHLYFGLKLESFKYSVMYVPSNSTIIVTFSISANIEFTKVFNYEIMYSFAAINAPSSLALKNNLPPLMSTWSPL